MFSKKTKQNKKKLTSEKLLISKFQKLLIVQEWAGLLHFNSFQYYLYVSDDSTDPFWPALHCFMVILDQLGSKVWGQLIDPVQAFQTIINSVSYNNEIKNIRNSFKRSVLLRY